MLTVADKKFIKELSHEMKTQDNRSTAQPYALVIRTKTRQIRDFDNCDNRGVYWEESEYDTFEEFINAFKEYYLEDGESHNAIDYLEEWVDDIEDLRSHEYKFDSLFNIQITTFAYEDVMTADSSKGLYEGNFFLTEKACRRHLKSNHYHFRDPDTYGIHLTRNPEMERLYEIIHKIAAGLK